MLALERKNLILGKLQREKMVVVSELSKEFDVSEETIRRDLEKLEKEGLAIKSYGGATIGENINTELPYIVRKKQNVEGKQKIARLAAELIQDGEYIMLGASSTDVYIAKALKIRKNLTVVTNSLEILLELSDMQDWNVISTGGRLKEGYLALIGSKTISSIQPYNVDKTIISCKAFDCVKGFSDSGDEVSQIKRAMLSAGKERILAVDSTKFGKLAFSRIGVLEDIDILITDQKPENWILENLQNAGVECLYPE